MRRWQNIVLMTLIAMGWAITAWLFHAAYSQDSVPAAPRKMIHLFSSDFPPNPVAQYPSPPMRETQFWQLLDKEMATTSSLTLTENLEDADYRVELRCTGVFNCSRLLVDIKNMDRDVLASFTIKNIAYWHVGPPKLDLVAQRLTKKLDERLQLLDKGGYGFHE
jgi:hypothetical protein